VLLTVIGLVALIALALLGFSIAIATGDHEEGHLRGYTTTGLLLGALAAALSIVALLYSLRKRAMQETMRASGSMMTWLWLHVTLGLLALGASVLHAGFGVISLTFSSGKALLIAFTVVSVSGIIWRVRYMTVPPDATRRVGNYSQMVSEKRAEELLTEIEKLAAGKSRAFHQLKDWLLAAPRTPAEIQNIPTWVPPEEVKSAEELAKLSGSRHRATERGQLQERYIKRLQGLRLLHIPLALALPVLLIGHIIGALRVHERVYSLGDAPSEAFSGFERAEDCAQCHRQIYDEWKESMHAHGSSSPVMIAQSNQILRAEYGALPTKEQQQFCVSCHGPLGVALTDQAQLPFQRSGYSDELLNEGVSCNVCHKYTGKGGVGVGALTSFQKAIEPGNVYYGPYKDPVGNAFHRSGTTRLFASPEPLCMSCHNVVFDSDGDGRIVKGPDLVLQNTQQEHAEYRAEGGVGSCISCHMPVRARSYGAAESALLYVEQDHEASKRVTHEHTFVGVDYPLDVPGDRDPHAPRREALLRSAARLELSALTVRGSAVSFSVSITNVGTGHNLPTGFAFARQMWLEVQGTDENGRILFSSGRLADPTGDVCDSSTMDDRDNPLRRHITGCSASDPQLVNIQGKLVTKRDVLRDAAGKAVLDGRGEHIVIEGEGARESVLQHLAGGVVARVRPSSKQKMTAIPPNDVSTFSYQFTMPRVVANPRVTVRLLFRNLPPYFLRALAEGQPAAEEPKVAPLIKNLRAVEMAKQTRSAR
jgi:hypothetical protein